MKVNFDELYLTQLQAKTPGYVIGLSEQQWLNLGASEADLKKLQNMKLNPKPLTHIKNQLTTMKRTFQAGLVVPGGQDWLILHDQKLKQFLSDFDAMEVKAAKLIQDFLDSYDDNLEGYQEDITAEFKKIKVYKGDYEQQQDLINAYIGTYCHYEDISNSWGFALFFPFNIGEYLKNVPAKGKKTIEGIITLSCESFESTALELCSEWLRLSDDLTKPIADESKKKQQQLLVDKLGSIAIYATAFKTIISKDIYDLISMCLGDVKLNKTKIRKQWAKRLLHSELKNIAERNMAYWIIAGSDPESNIIASPKSRPNRKHWEQESTIKGVHDQLKVFI